MRSLVLGLGNELIADDGIGILAARNLKSNLRDEANVIESSLSGLALLDLLVGYDRVIIIDSICSGNNPPGTITQLNMGDLSSVVAPTPHFAGLPEVFALADRLEQALPRLIDQVSYQIARWNEQCTESTST
jgi:hydrogenase maturation protease